MAISEEQRRSRARPSAAFLPEDLIVGEILVRLPAKDLLRCRAVCRAWRHRTSAADFLIAHHRCQPSLLLVHTCGEAIDVDAAFDTMDLRQRPTELQPVLRFNDDPNGSGSLMPVLRASCDGLILLSVLNILYFNQRFYLCNPATRQWISVPVPCYATVLGMYSHSPTGEYRVLYWESSQLTGRAVYYVLTLGSAEPRCIEEPIGTPSVQTFVEFALEDPYFDVEPSIFLHDCLYWLSPNSHKQNGIVVFDTTRESFRLMRLPTEACQLQQDDDVSWYLLEIDGALGISLGCEIQMMMQLWVLHDYETEAWSLEYQIGFSLADLSGIRGVVRCPPLQGMIVSKDGDALVYCFNSRQLFHLDSKGKFLQTLHRDGLLPGHTGIRFKESLVRHAFLEGPREGAPSGEPQFFVGL